MPELDYVPYSHCLSAEGWSRIVNSSNGKMVYTVRYDRNSHINREVQHDYSCDCWAYKTGKGKYCKHILSVKEHHCNWQQFIDGEEVIDRPEGRFCPKCGNEVGSRMYGI